MAQRTTDGTDTDIAVTLEDVMQDKTNTEQPQEQIISVAAQQPTNINNESSENNDFESDMVDLSMDNEILGLTKGHKCFVISSGKTLDADKKLIHHLRNQVPGLQVVDKEEDCDFILVFCPIVSRAATDIEAALEKLQHSPETKPAVFVVLHYTFNPDHVVPDSSRIVKRKKTITADFLYHEDQGLLQCAKNDESLNRIMTCLNIQIPRTGFGLYLLSIISSFCGSCRDGRLQDEDEKLLIPETPNKEIKCFILSSGKTLNVQKNLTDHLRNQVPDLQLVDKEEDCDFILVFCQIVSRAGTDIEQALMKLKSISETKPAVVVVLHHTFDPDLHVPDSSRIIKREKTITVDVLFHEDQGLLRCSKNEESSDRVINHLKANNAGWFNTGSAQQPSIIDQSAESLSDFESDHSGSMQGSHSS